MKATAPGIVAPLHHHDYNELFIVHAGRGTYTIGEEIVEAGPGDVVLIPAGMPHRYANRTEETLYHTAGEVRGRSRVSIPLPR